MSPASLGTVGQGQHCSSRGCAGRVWALPADGRTPLLLVPKLGLALERGTVCGIVPWHLCFPSEPYCEQANAHLLCGQSGWNTQLGNGGLNPPLSLPPQERAVESRGQNQLLPGCFPKLCLQKGKREQGEGEGEAGPVGGQAGDTEPSSRGSQLSSGSHSSLTSSPVRCWSQPTAPATWLWGCWAHLGVTVPGWDGVRCTGCSKRWATAISSP